MQKYSYKIWKDLKGKQTYISYNDSIFYSEKVLYESGQYCNSYMHLKDSSFIIINQVYHSTTDTYIRTFIQSGTKKDSLMWSINTYNLAIDTLAPIETIYSNFLYSTESFFLVKSYSYFLKNKVSYYALEFNSDIDEKNTLRKDRIYKMKEKRFGFYYIPKHILWPL